VYWSGGCGNFSISRGICDYQKVVVMNTVDLQWVGNGLILAATYLLAHKRKSSLVYYSLGNACWITWALPHHVWGIVALDGILTVLNVRAWITWRMDERGGKS